MGEFAHGTNAVFFARFPSFQRAQAAEFSLD